MKAAARAAALALVALLAAGCRKGPKSHVQAAPSASGSSGVAGVPPAPVASGLPGDPMRTSRIVNPKGERAYGGPTGGVRGTVTVSGDPAPTMDALVAKIPESCAPARAFYGPMFREGMMRSLADVLVAVTGYQGYVPEREPAETVLAKQCAFHTRTVVLTYGQSLRLVSKDREVYVPALLGSSQPVQILAVPGGQGSDIYAQNPGRYVLSDSMKIFMFADVFVLKYSTHAVTGLDGRYQIDGVPVGDVTVSALLPATGATVEKKLKIEPGKVLDVNLEFVFEAKQHAARSAAQPASEAGQGARPSAPAPPKSP